MEWHLRIKDENPMLATSNLFFQTTTALKPLERPSNPHDDTLKLLEIQRESAGEYFCTGSNDVGTPATTKILLSVQRKTNSLPRFNTEESFRIPWEAISAKTVLRQQGDFFLNDNFPFQTPRPSPPLKIPSKFNPGIGQG